MTQPISFTPVKPTMRTVLLLLSTIAVTACSAVPDELRLQDDAPPNYAEVQGREDAFENAAVRWGGVLAGVDNEADRTCLHVVEKPLDYQARPRETDASAGRFLACREGFLDPAIYQSGREVTVRGRIAGARTIKVGEFDFPYVVLQADAVKLWPVRQPEKDDWDDHHRMFWPWWYPRPIYHPAYYYPKERE